MNARREAKYRKYIKINDTPTRNFLLKGVAGVIGGLLILNAFGEYIDLVPYIRMRIERADDAMTLEGKGSFRTFLREYYRDGIAHKTYCYLKEKLLESKEKKIEESE